MDVYHEIRKFCEDNVTIFGFSNLKNYKDEIFLDQLKNFDYGISIGINIPDNIVENLDNNMGRINYMYANTDINNLLDDAASHITKILEDNGYEAINVDSSYILPGENFMGEISHKIVANLAGLGWIGKSALLINPYYGPRIRWATILTNAVLPAENKRMKSRCNSCHLCVENCPVNAFNDADFDENVSRDERYNASACSAYFKKLETNDIPVKCGICVKVCPWGLVNKTSRTKEDIYKFINRD